MKFVERLKAITPSHYSNKQIRQAIDLACCRLNGRINRIATTPVNIKDRIEIDLKRYEALKKTNLQRWPLLFEDPFFKILEKPRGELSDIKAYPGLVHRLDKETSGLIIQAKTKQIEEAFKVLFKEQKIEKTYLALVEGVMKEELILTWPILRGGKIKGFETFKADLSRKDPKGKSAWTRVIPLKVINGKTLVECFPKTGRTHQIRIHLMNASYPIVGDMLYGKNQDPLIHRMMLHAVSLSFPHPVTHKEISFRSSQPFLDSCGLKSG